MKYYTVAEIDVLDRGWVRAYVERVTALVEQHGGRYLARTHRFETFEGERPPPQMYLLIEWPSKAACERFYASAEYRPFLAARRSGSRGQFALVAGEDANGVARV